MVDGPERAMIHPVYMNPGYVGEMPLTISNFAPFEVTIVPGLRVAQLVCAKLSGAPAEVYNEKADAKYVGERGAPSMLHTDEDIQLSLKRILASVPPRLLEES